MFTWDCDYPRTSVNSAQFDGMLRLPQSAAVPVCLNQYLQATSECENSRTEETYYEQIQTFIKTLFQF
jgi:hypothetical protein